MHALLTDVLGVERCVAAGGDVGGVVIYDLGLRFPGFVLCHACSTPCRRCCRSCTSRPASRVRSPARCAWPGTISSGRAGTRTGSRQSWATPEKRRRYIAQLYGSRFWAASGSFTPEDVDFMTELFADAGKLRAGFGVYETALRTRPPAEVPRFFETSPVPTLVLYGPEDTT